MRVYPIYTDLSAPRMVDANIIAPTKVPDSEELTQFLAFNKKVDLIAIGLTESMLDCGIADVTDMLDENVRINKVAYTMPVKNSKTGAREVKYLDVSRLMGAAFVRSQHNFREVVLKLKTPLEGGVFEIYGSLSLEIGTLDVQAKIDKEEVELLGYEIEAYRFNPNRRPATGQPPGQTNTTLHNWPSNNDGRGRPRKDRGGARDREAED